MQIGQDAGFSHEALHHRPAVRVQKLERDALAARQIARSVNGARATDAR